MIKCTNIVLPLLARVGDRVFVNVDQRDAQDSPAAEALLHRRGQVGTIIGFNEYLTAEDRYGHVHPMIKPGFYLRKSEPIVQWDDLKDENGEPKTEVVSCHYLACLPPADSMAYMNFFEKVMYFETYNKKLHEQRQAERPTGPDAYVKEKLSEMRFIGSFPEVPFWELDEVVSTDNMYGTIEGLDWPSLEEKCSDGSPFPWIRVKLHEGGSSAFRTSDLKLVRHGNVWAWYNDKSKLRFQTIEDMIILFRGVGMLEEVRNHKGNYAGMTFSEYRERERQGEVDCTEPHQRNGNGLFRAYKARTTEVSTWLRKSLS